MSEIWLTLSKKHNENVTYNRLHKIGPFFEFENKKLAKIKGFWAKIKGF
jgi:hypothetical protein